MAFEVEQIPDDSGVTRLVDFPHMTQDRFNLIADTLFSFSYDKKKKVYDGVSICWNKYAPPPDAVHALGCCREQVKRHSKPEFRYVGFIESTAGKVRTLQSGRGHGFTLEHKPSIDEGQHHAEIYYLQNPSADKIHPHERVELRQILKEAFSEIRPHTCLALEAADEST